jgi:putative (di)nucleoside polyphosphate hydrolase
MSVAFFVDPDNYHRVGNPWFIMQTTVDYRSGIGIVLVNRDGLIFGGCRNDGRIPPWQMPQGGLQDGESCERAVLRELAEELGTAKAAIVEAYPTWLSYDYPSTSVSARASHYRGQRHKWFLAQFTGHDGDISVATEHAEFSDWRWMTADDLINRVVPFKRQVYRHVFAHFAPVIRRMRDSQDFRRSVAEARAAAAQPCASV